uniref:PID domain-containing protein n=1 Tax=Anopheles aquasalis TaxID=42839 RepID=T1DQQ1_ANOAQ
MELFLIIGLLDPAVLIEGVLFRARYLGSTQLVCEGQPTKSTRMMQAEEAVSRIKVRTRHVCLVVTPSSLPLCAAPFSLSLRPFLAASIFFSIMSVCALTQRKHSVLISCF